MAPSSPNIHAVVLLPLLQLSAVRQAISLLSDSQDDMSTAAMLLSVSTGVEQVRRSACATSMWGVHVASCNACAVMSLHVNHVFMHMHAS